MRERAVAEADCVCWAWASESANRPMACSRLSCTQEPVRMSWKWVNSTPCQAFSSRPVGAGVPSAMVRKAASFSAYSSACSVFRLPRLMRLWVV